VEELSYLRKLVLSCGLKEELKWKMPCYTVNGKNVVMISAFKDSCVLSFFKGTLLKDESAILQRHGENSHIARILRFSEMAQILKIEDLIKAYIFEAIEIENKGLKVQNKPPQEPIPKELEIELAAFPDLQKAFKALTPGKQRGYILHISAAKQSETRKARIEKCIPKILLGKGFHDR